MSTEKDFEITELEHLEGDSGLAVEASEDNIEESFSEEDVIVSEEIALESELGPEISFEEAEITESEQSEINESELGEFESAEIEDVEFVEEERLDSIIESLLFASDRPVSLNQLKIVFKGTNIKTDKIRRALDKLAVELAGAQRGVTLEEVPGGYQLRTKVDNMNFLVRTMKSRPFRLSGPALEVLSIVAYKQPVIKAEIDEIRGVESGHLLRALMEKGLVNFEGKSDFPGRPMLYATTRKFLEIFGLRNLKELPTLSQIDELLPEGIDEQVAEKPTLGQLTDSLSQQAASTYSEGEEELNKITGQLEEISTSSDFFEQEKLRQKQKRDQEKAQSLREALLVGEEISTRDKNWLLKYDEALAQGESSPAVTEQEENLETTAIAALEEASTAEDGETLFEDDENHSDDEELAVPYHDEEDSDSN